jgi:hypothetical protein
MGRRRAMPNTDVQMNQGLLRGASYYPYDLLGSPIDLINMGLKPLGMGLQKPVMGSDYLQSLAQQYGLSQQPTGSNAENVARLAMSAMNPATGARAVGRAIEPTMQALAPKAAQMAEDYLRSIGGIADIAPQGKKSMTAMQLAQKNAALPISEGGLGLPANNTAMDRAKALGYDTPVYHGTNQDIEAFNVEGKGKTAGAGAFLTTNPITAETYVSASGGGNILPLLLKKDNFLTANARGRNWADIYTNELNARAGKNRYTPQELGLDINSATSTDELGMIANDLSLKGAEIKNVRDLGPNSHVMRSKEYLFNKYGIVPDETFSNVTGEQWAESQRAMQKLYDSQKSDIYAVQDPSLIRSRFAAFDPKRINEPNLLAGVIPFGLLKDDEEY